MKSRPALCFILIAMRCGGRGSKHRPRRRADAGDLVCREGPEVAGVVQAELRPRRGARAARAAVQCAQVLQPAVAAPGREWCS
jgi:hypothetical protein